jgi:aspartate racemase
VARTAGGIGFTKIGLTGTDFTMSDGFYQAALEERGLEVVLPEPEDRQAIHRIIYDELVAGIVRPESQDAFAEIAVRLARQGAEVVLLGCTELELLTRDRSLKAPSIDTTFTHAVAAWKHATGQEEYPLVTAGDAG